MGWVPEIFKAYDIRGGYGREFDEDFGFAVGAALVQHTGSRQLLVGYDDRAFSRPLAYAVASGMAGAGSAVRLIGLATTPFFDFCFGKLGASAGVMVTASHNPPEYGGFKLFGKGGHYISANSGLLEIQKLIKQDQLPAAGKEGIISEADRGKLLEEYVDFAIGRIRFNGSDLRTVAVSIRGPRTAADEIRLLRSKLGIAEAARPTLNFSFDEDADRVFVHDRTGRRVSGDMVLGLLAKDMVRFLTKPRIVCDLRFSRGVLAKFSEWSFKVFKCKVGSQSIKDAMHQHHADIGGELSGHIFYRETHYNEMPILTVVRFLRMLARSRMGIEELIRPFQTWAGSGEINLPNDKGRFERVRAVLEAKYADAEVKEIDGISVDYPEWWFNLRPSNTEPLLRLVVEAKTKDQLEEKVSELTALISA